MTRLVLMLMMALPLVGCRDASGPTAYTGVTSTTVVDYPLAFETTKDVLREMGFELDRVDASSGVITTRPRTGAGLATPWIVTETPVRDLVQRDRRRARVTFTAASVDEEPPRDLRAHDGTFDVAWVIDVERIYVPGRRPSPTTVRLGGTWVDRDLPVEGERGRFAKTIETDDELAARAVERFLDRLGDAPGT